MVKIQAQTMRRVTCHLTDEMLLAALTPVTAPFITWVVNTGILRWLAIKMQAALAGSIFSCF